MSGWEDFERELAAWQAAGGEATLWWRDDDATRPTAALEAVLALSRTAAVPVALAVIPEGAADALADRLADAGEATVLQHGYAHANHAADGERQTELGPERPVAVRLAELAEGRRRLGAFRRALPVLVAPWNRIDPALVPALPAAGLAGLSTLGPRPAAVPAPGVRQVNVHADIMDWETRRFAGDERVLGQLTRHLAARRSGAADPAEPTGVMSHHAFHDREAVAFLAALFEVTRGRARWLAAGEAFGR